jgi:hypothetical protein
MALQSLMLAVGLAGAVPLTVGEGQVTTLQFANPVKRAALSSEGVIQVKPTSTRVEVTGKRAGRATILVVFEGGASLSYEVEVIGAKREGGTASAPSERGSPAEIGLGQEMALPAPDVERVLVADDDVVRVKAEKDKVLVTGTRIGSTSVIMVDRSGNRLTYQVRVR